jgi:hypothetical protein
MMKLTFGNAGLVITAIAICQNDAHNQPSFRTAACDEAAVDGRALSWPTILESLCPSGSGAA